MIRKSEKPLVWERESAVQNQFGVAEYSGATAFKFLSIHIFPKCTAALSTDGNAVYCLAQKLILRPVKEWLTRIRNLIHVILSPMKIQSTALWTAQSHHRQSLQSLIIVSPYDYIFGPRPCKGAKWRWDH
jgi:hypothetical protein